MMTDPIADMLTRIRNGYMARQTSVVIPASKVKRAIATILKEHDYVADVRDIEGTPQRFEVVLKYHGRTPAIRSLKRESKPGHRAYRKSTELPRILNDYGIAIVSTSQGLMTNKQAREAGIGGELICSVY